MHSTRLLNALVLALSTISIARATIIDPNIAGRHDGEIERRKADSGVSIGLGGATTSTDSQSTTPTSTEKTSSTAEPTSTSTPPTTTSKEAPTTSSTPATTSSTPETTSAPQSSSSSPAAQSTVTLVITTTNSLGSMTSYTTEATTTPSASLSSSQGSTSGMSTQTRNTVIGVVVGVGGAIVLVAIALVAWRIWGRKKSQDEGDGLMGYGAGYSAAEKSEAGGSASGRTPFQSTLESYHAPTQVNQASNF